MITHTFIRTKMSDGCRQVLRSYDVHIEDWTIFVDEATQAGCKVSLRQDMKFGGFSFSLTGAKEGVNEGKILSCFGSDLQDAGEHLQLLLSLCDGLEADWETIPTEIKSLEGHVAQIIREALPKLRQQVVK